jgi:hypothetical protein
MVLCNEAIDRMQMDSLDIIGIAISVMAIVIVLSFSKDKSYLE